MHFFHFLRYLALLCLCTALAQDSTFDFAGRVWIRKSHRSERVGPGFNYFSGMVSLKSSSKT